MILNQLKDNVNIIKKLIMCWIGKNKPKIAKCDIQVYKIVFCNDRSYYQNYQYHDGLQNQIIIESGSFIAKYCCIKEGYHSYADLFMANFYYGNIKIVPCIIPKGIKYYVNDCNEVVSENIIYNKELSSFKKFISEFIIKL